MTDQEIPKRYRGDEPELEKKVIRRLKSWKALRKQDGTLEGTMESIAIGYELQVREVEIQRAVVGHLVQRIEDMGKELAKLRKKND